MVPPIMVARLTVLSHVLTLLLIKRPVKANTTSICPKIFHPSRIRERKVDGQRLTPVRREYSIAVSAGLHSSALSFESVEQSAQILVA